MANCLMANSGGLKLHQHVVSDIGTSRRYITITLSLPGTSN